MSGLHCIDGDRHRGAGDSIQFLVATNSDKKNFVIRLCFGVVHMLLAVIALSALVPEVNPGLILLRIYFGLVYLIMVHGIVSTVLERICLGLEALEAIEEQERIAQDAGRQEELRGILANIPPTDYVLARRGRR